MYKLELWPFDYSFKILHVWQLDFDQCGKNERCICMYVSYIPSIYILYPFLEIFQKLKTTTKIPILSHNTFYVRMVFEGNFQICCTIGKDNKNKKLIFAKIGEGEHGKRNCTTIYPPPNYNQFFFIMKE